MNLQGYCSRCNRIVRNLIETPGCFSTHCCFVCGTPIYDKDSIVPADKPGFVEELIVDTIKKEMLKDDPLIKAFPVSPVDTEKDLITQKIWGDEEGQRQRKWDLRFLSLAREVASWSKDPSTKVGAVIVEPDLSIVSVGFNGFARKVKDTRERYEDRDIKYKIVVHGEINAIIFGDRRRIQGATLYTWPLMPCSNCSGTVINAGIARVVAPPTPEDMRERWEKSLALSRTSFEEAGVILDLVEMED